MVSGSKKHNAADSLFIAHAPKRMPTNPLWIMTTVLVPSVRKPEADVFPFSTTVLLVRCNAPTCVVRAST